MKKAKTKYLCYAMLSLFILLTVVLGIINAVNFTMAANDADRITQIIADRKGYLIEQQKLNGGKHKNKKNTETADTPQKNDSSDKNEDIPPFDDSGAFGPMGQGSPETNNSVRYFTYIFYRDGHSEKAAFQISAVDEDEAEKWAESLINESTGWTRGTYRYRVFEYKHRTYVTIIDQGRELLPSYRILIISVCGELAGLAISFLVLTIIGNRLFRPLEEADRKQKSFIANVENKFKIPLTIISASMEIIEKEKGADDYTITVNRQIKKMGGLVKELGTLAIFDESELNKTTLDLSYVVKTSLEIRRKAFKDQKLALDIQIEDNIELNGDEEVFEKIVDELTENTLHYAKTHACFELFKEKERIILRASNDTDLPNGDCERVFDRFNKLKNAENSDSAGLGLSYVKNTVKAHNGRAAAKTENGEFIVTLAL